MKISKDFKVSLRVTLNWRSYEKDNNIDNNFLMASFRL